MSCPPYEPCGSTRFGRSGRSNRRALDVRALSVDVRANLRWTYGRLRWKYVELTLDVRG